jgi:hypothetical protein
MTKKIRLTQTARGDIVPDVLVADLFECGWEMVTFFATDKNLQDTKPIVPGQIISTTHPYAKVWSLSNVFMDMMTGEQIVLDDDKIYRLKLHEAGWVEVMCFGVSSVDRTLDLSYKCVDDLPEWAKQRLAVLSLLDPTKINNEVEKVGRRINRNVFWIYPEQ